MQSARIALAIVTLASVARAEAPHLDLHVGIGIPAGGFGLGTRLGPVEVVGEGEVIGAAFVMMLSASAHLNVDVFRRPRYGIYTGVFACLMHVVAGSDEVFEETYRGAGAVGGLRLHHHGLLSHDIEAGAFYGRCADQMCNDGTAFVSVQLAYRLHFHLF